MAKHVFLGIALILLMLAFNGCAFVNLKKDVETIETMVAISGEIVNQSPQKRPLVVMLITQEEERKEIKNYGFEEEHVGILSSPAVVEKFKEIISRIYAGR